MHDAPRSGRTPSVTTAEFELIIVDKTLHEKPIAATHWSARTLAAQLGVGATTDYKRHGTTTLFANLNTLHALGDDLPPLLTYALEGSAEVTRARILDGLGHDHAARLRNRLQARRDLHAVVADGTVRRFDDIARVDCNSEAQPEARRIVMCLREAVLDRCCCSCCAGDRSKDEGHGIGGSVDNPPVACLGLRPENLQGGQRRKAIKGHPARVTRRIRGQDGQESMSEAREHRDLSLRNLAPSVQLETAGESLLADYRPQPGLCGFSALRWNASASLGGMTKSLSRRWVCERVSCGAKSALVENTILDSLVEFTRTEIIARRSKALVRHSDFPFHLKADTSKRHPVGGFAT
jgi:hypothetical protein